MHKRQSFYLTLYLALFLITGLFVALAATLDKQIFYNLSGMCVILWIPLILGTVFTALPQTAAGNVFSYLKNERREMREEKIKAYCSSSMIDSEMFAELLDRDQYSKPVRIFKIRRESGKGVKVYQVQLKNFSKYKVTVVRKNREEDLHYTTPWVVNAVEELKK